MLRPSTLPLALACVLVGLHATAAQATAVERSVVLTDKPSESPVLHLAPGAVTVLLLDAPLIRESVEVEGRARFARVDPGEQGLTLVLGAPLGPGERLALRFTYREGSPRNAMFLLTGQPGPVAGVVNVSRPQLTVAAGGVELSATHERREASAKELEGSKAPALSPAAMALAGFVSWAGMRGKSFKHKCRAPHGELRPAACWGLGAETWSVVVLEVSNTGAEPWVPAWAEVTPEAGGEPRRARTVLISQAALPPGGTVSVAVEVEMPLREEPTEWLLAPHSLRVCDAAGSRCVSVSQVWL